MGGTRNIQPWRHVVGLQQRNERPKVEGSVGRVGRSFRRGKLATCRKGGDVSCEVVGVQGLWCEPDEKIEVTLSRYRIS